MFSKASWVTTTDESERAQEMKLVHYPWTGSLLEYPSYKMIHVTCSLMTKTLNDVLPLFSLLLRLFPSISSHHYEEKKQCEGPSLNFLSEAPKVTLCIFLEPLYLQLPHSAKKSSF